MSKVKVAKVITTSFIPRVVRERTELCGRPLGYFSHSQNFTTEASIIDLVKFNIEKELECDPGVDVDLIIVNNDTGWKYGKDYLNSLERTKLKRGNIRVFHRDNFGRSFGGYNFAFEKLKDLYDFFIFTEDDILISFHNYAAIAIEIFNSIENCGFVAFQELSTKSHFNLSKEETIHAHGGVGLSSSNVLNSIVKKYGSLPHSSNYQSQKYTDIIQNGEIKFTNIIHNMGYHLISVPKNIKLYTFVYDEMRGITNNRYASFLDNILYTVKEKVYKIRSKLGV